MKLRFLFSLRAPHLSLLLLLLFLFSGLTTLAQTTSFTSVTNNTYATTTGTQVTATDVAGTGWDFTTVTDGTARVIGASGTGQSAGALGANDPFVRTGRTSATNNFIEGRVRRTAGTAFKLNSIYLQCNFSGPLTVQSITLFGYRGGSQVASLTQAVTTTATWSRFVTSSIAAFNNVDELRATVASTPNGGGQVGTVGWDEINITVAPANQAPTIANQTRSVAENTANGTNVGAVVTASDPDAGQTLTYAITAGNAAGKFAINSSTGQLTVAGALDFETTSSYALTVRVTDDAATPASSSATVTVSVTDVPAPAISVLNPTSGPVGTSVTLTGTNFTGATGVSFNGTAATTFSVTNATTATATVPAGASTGNVTLTTGEGTSATSASTVFTVTVPAPTITSANPTSGPVATLVTLTGTNFTGATQVTFGSAPFTSNATFTVMNATTITATVPLVFSPGPNDVIVVTPAGSSNPVSFTVTFLSAPTVTTTAPASVTSSAATLGGNVTSDGGSAVTERGVVYVLGAGTPTTNTNKLMATGTTGAYTVNATGLTAGTLYTTRAYATNSLGTSYGSSVSFTTTAALAASISSQTNISCNGGSNGSATVTATGGTAPYTYRWNTSPLQTTATATGLAAGPYTVTVTDANSATATATATITQPASAVGGTGVVTNVACNGGSNGTINLTPTGGTSPYTFSWGGGVTTEDRTGLAAGTYTVTITDANACTGTVSATITAPLAITSSISAQTNVSCFGGSTGSATVSVSGGTAGYTYSWNTSPVQTTATATGLSAGTYTLTITDANSCTKTQAVTISQPASALTSSVVTTSVGCFGSATGAINLTPGGGTSPYTFNWGGGVTTEDRTGLPAGTYTVTITDANGCTRTQSATISQPASALAVTTSKTDATTNGGTDGTATAAPSGGTAGYTYNWNTSPVQTTATATGLPAGTYTVTVTDANSCTATASATVGQPAPAPVNLTISTGTAAAPVSIAAGTYNTITVTGTGYGQLAGAVVVTTGVTVQGGLNTNCQALTGSGSFALAAGGTLAICDANGISSTGSTGAVQVTGTRSFNADASYVYNGTAAQSTGAGLPAQLRALTTSNATDVTLSQAVAVAQTLTVANAGNLVLNGQPLTLLSSATGTALAVNGGTGVVVGSTATAQRYLDPSLNAGPGYRHVSPPVRGASPSSLSTASYPAVLNTAYNASATPGTTTPFPTAFVYDQRRLATTANNLSAFDKGWVVPVFRGGLVPANGVALNIGGGEQLAFTGTLNTGDYTLALERNTDATAPDAGWALVGNPYPAPLDYSLVTPADRTGLDAAIYVFESSSQYAGSYRANVNGVGGNANSGSALVGSGQAFFVRVSTGQSNVVLNFRNSQRVRSYATQVAVRRGAADTRPLVQLRLQGGSAPADDAFVYVETGATPGFDAAFDAAKLPNTTGLNLSVTTTAGQNLAIQGLPALTTATVVPLTVDLPATGAYALTAPALNNLPATTRVELVDNLTGTRQDLRALPAAGYAFTAAGTHLAGRFALNLTPAGVLATNPAALAAQVLAYPNPAHDRLTLVRPAGAATSAELVNALGQVVRRFALPTPETSLDVRALATGVYVLRLTLDGQPVRKRVVLE